MLLCFELDGDKAFAKVENIGNRQLAIERGNALLARQPFRYDWDDGRFVTIEVVRVDGDEAHTIRRLSKGFCGYGWMIKSILNHGEIRL